LAAFSLRIDNSNIRRAEQREGALALPNKHQHPRRTPLLMKWRFAPADKGGEAGEARYWWSDGSKTQEPVASHADAVSRLKAIQDTGGVKPS
jgi:hypothetical protein